MPDAPPPMAGPVKWAAIGALGMAAIAGLGISLFLRSPRATAVVPHAQREVAPSAPSAGDPPPATQPAPGSSQPRRPVDVKPATLGKININAASAAEIELLPGIGPALAQRIIEYRAEHGNFTSLKDLDAVRGIGPKLIEKIAPMVTFE